MVPVDPSIGRMSHITYIGPKLSTLLMPLDTDVLPKTGADLDLVTGPDREVIS